MPAYCAVHDDDKAETCRLTSPSVCIAFDTAAVEVGDHPLRLLAEHLSLTDHGLGLVNWAHEVVTESSGQ